MSPPITPGSLLPSTPAIHDPNTGITLWESGAIIEYLIAEYDKEHKISFDSSPDKYYAMQYLHFQMSGQGPYFGQAAWFAFAHPEKIASALDRYFKEIGRVTAVLDGLLSDKEYLVGGKCSYADLAFIPWYQLVPLLGSNGTDEQKAMLKLDEKYPHYAKWMKAMLERPAVKKVLADKAEVLKQQH